MSGPLEAFLPDDAAGGPAAPPLRDDVARALAAAPPEAGPALARVLERAAAPGDLLAGLACGPGLARALALVGLGGRPVETLMGEPRDLALLAGPFPDPAALDLADLDLEGLRGLRRRTTLALAAGELAGELEAAEAAARLSAVAERLLDAALELARGRAVERFGEAARSARVAVLAFGKLGGAELNYSSDVDLVLVRADDAVEAACELVARRFVAAVQASSAQGRLYRVDLRLRPYGSSGPLVPRLSAFLRYHREHGRTWERQALLKARPVAGDPALGAEALAGVAPLVFRTDLDGREIREILALRERMAGTSDEAERDVKVGPGGIRDVEFCVQFLQLLEGAAHPEVRAPNTLEAIERLRSANLLGASEAEALAASYRFLRRLEHLLQLVGDRELTRLPRGDALRPLAGCLGLTPAGLEERLARTQVEARGILDRLVRASFTADAAPAADRALQDLLLAQSPDARRAAKVLAPAFREPDAAWRHLEALARERHALLAPTGRARTLLAGLAPRLLEAIRATPDPDRTLRNLQRATAGLGAKATVYQLMAEQPDALGLLVDLAAGSDVLSEVLARHPGVFDEVIDRLLTRTPPRRDEVEAEAGAALAAAGDPAPGLREVRALYLLLVGALDLGGRANVQNTARGLADLAEGLLLAFVDHAVAGAAARHGGRPPGGRFAALALGRLGGRELAYASDVDLVCVYEGAAPAPDGTTPLAFWAEVTQAVVRLGEGAASVEGALLPIDLRLRPGGRSAPLATSRATLLAYYRGEGPGERARPFELLALQKARPVAGDPDLGEELAADVVAALYPPALADPAALWAEVADMRRRQRDARGADDLKRGRGSLSDIELTASALALAHGGADPALRQPNTVVLLEALERAGHLGPARHRDLRTAYGFLRRVELRLRARTWQPTPRLPPPGPERDELARSLGYVAAGGAAAGDHLMAELDHHRGRVEAICRELAP